MSTQDIQKWRKIQKKPNRSLIFLKKQKHHTAYIDSFSDNIRGHAANKWHFYSLTVAAHVLRVLVGVLCVL